MNKSLQLRGKSLIRLLVQEIGTLECLEAAGPCHGFATDGVEVAFPNEQVVHVVNDGLAVQTVHFALFVQEEVAQEQVQRDVTTWVVDVLLLKVLKNLNHICMSTSIECG